MEEFNEGQFSAGEFYEGEFSAGEFSGHQIFVMKKIILVAVLK